MSDEAGKLWMGIFLFTVGLAGTFEVAKCDCGKTLQEIVPESYRRVCEMRDAAERAIENRRLAEMLIANTDGLSLN